ncbi:protein kinase domain-containing protein [Cryptosporidium muris RN66]|uniref:non-specific serine/threonine protein kinase n=1 Tax=Cryptosporidium muris (strain RN66) TaxID=441375 RepID=B6ADX0_CRYMR|nr:protein kinase domain-containing protein [Cryptosporidium muris RN66]EEA06411.1 protein kinase domain-containing protein [Cryptosporidium muris RN66]|eukprot:XP_002140760.1 protein kinase domain-containing protein [Cryptosporidium muris RN66]
MTNPVAINTHDYDKGNNNEEKELQMEQEHSEDNGYHSDKKHDTTDLIYAAMCTKCAGELEHEKNPEKSYCSPRRISGIEQVSRGLIIESKSFLDANRCMAKCLDKSGQDSSDLCSSPEEKTKNSEYTKEIGYSLKNNDILHTNHCLFDRTCLIQEHALKNRNINDYYDLNLGNLGRGSYGSVVKAIDKQSGACRAVKVIFKPKLENINRLKREILIMKRLDHPNIIKLFEVFEDTNYLYFVMEICTGGELFDRIIKRGHFSERYAAIIMKQVFSAIAYCHANEFMHRDLKPENLLFADSSSNSLLKVIDWGFAAKCPKSHKFTSIVGTPYYVAPEVLSGSYSKLCDLWSAGVILYILLCGYPPFHGKDNTEILKRVKTGKYSFDHNSWKYISDLAKDLIKRLLMLDPNCRITAQDALCHPWLKTLISKPVSIESGYFTSDICNLLLKRFRDFQRQNKLKKLALTCVAYHLSDADIGALQNLFSTLDRNGDGVLSISEMRSALHKIQHVAQFGDDIDALLLELDTDGNGRIDYTEFLAASIDHKLYEQESLCKAAFKVFDLDMDGRISPSELHRVLNSTFVQEAFERSTIQSLLEEVDTNQDGYIDFSEFMDMMIGEKDRHINGVIKSQESPNVRVNSSTITKHSFFSGLLDIADILKSKFDTSN